MPVRDIKIIKQGSILIEAFEEPSPQTIGLKKLAGTGGGSTVTYLESDQTILVDTGYDYEANLSPENREANRVRLLQALAAAGLAPGDIDVVFITHWHADHFMNASLFSGSEIMLLQPAVDRHSLSYRGVVDGEEIADGVRVVATM